jgi:hypothetical protein
MAGTCCRTFATTAESLYATKRAPKLNMDSVPFSRHQERPAWLLIRLDGENLQRAPLEQLEEMWGLYERACVQFPERHVELLRLWGRPVAVAVIVDGRLAHTRTVAFVGEIRADYDRICKEHPGADVRMVEVFGQRALRDELIAEKKPQTINVSPTGSAMAPVAAPS